MEIVHFQREDLAFTPPKNKACSLAIRIIRYYVCQHLRPAFLSLGLEIQTDTSTRASPNHTQLFHSVKSIGRYVNQCVIEKPTYNSSFIPSNDSVHDSHTLDEARFNFQCRVPSLALFARLGVITLK